MMKKITTTLLAMFLTIMVANLHLLTAQTLFHEGFDDGVLPACWTVVDADGDGYTWDATFQYQENPSEAYVGDGMIASASYINEEGALFPDNWLISPAISIPGNAILTFWVKGQDASYFAENYSVYIATSNTVAAFEQTSPVLTGTTIHGWEQKVVDLGAYAGQTIYIAFRHHNSTDMYWLDLDEVDIEADCLSPVSLSVQDVTGSAAMLTWQNAGFGSPLYYEVSYKMFDDIEWTVSDPVHTEYLMLSGLQQQTSYMVRVRKCCDTGVFSSYSDTVDVNTGCSFGSASIIIGETTTSTNGNVIPTNTYYNYSYTQQIFRASELESARLIEGIGFQYFYGSQVTRNVNIYLGHTQKSSFSSNNDWIPLAELTLVYSGNLIFQNTGNGYWVNVLFDTTFAYNGVDNLVVAFDDNTGSYQYSGNKFYTHQAFENASMYAYSDGTNYNPASPVTGSRVAYRSNLYFQGECMSDVCDKSNLSVTDVTDSSALLVFVGGVGSIDYELEYKRVSDADYISLSAEDETYLLTGLRHNTKYVARIRSLCDDGESSWKTVRFTTRVKNVDRLYVTTTGEGSGVSWSTATNDLNWALETASRIRSVYGTISDIWVAAGTYYGDTLSDNAFTMHDGVNVYGGFAGDEPADYDLSMRDFEANETILDGDSVRRVLYQPSHFNTETFWDGFSLQNGMTGNNGGGVYCRGNGVLNNCIIRNNTANIFGGGVYAYGSNDNVAKINNCLIRNNTANSGGGLWTFQSVISNCKIRKNRGLSSAGGGVYANSYTMVSNCEITNNGGPGVYVFAETASIINCLVTNNGYYGITGKNAQIINSIVCGSDVSVSGTNMVCSYSAIEGGFPGEGNIPLMDVDNYRPLFVNPSRISGLDDTTSNVDWHLQYGSVCINRGENVFVIDSFDLDGTARIKLDTVDMGCYESDYYGVYVDKPNYSNIVYVTQNGSGTQSGESWTNATSSINFANVIAYTYSMPSVWVAKGTYYGDTLSTFENAFMMRDGVSVYGGFAGNEPADYDLSLRDFEVNETILDGDSTRRVLHQSYNFNNETVWNGFTIQNGHVGYGGGVYLLENGLLSQCVIKNNYATSFGGGIYMSKGTVTNCSISNNRTNGGIGGGLYVRSNSTVSNCLISSNYGGGVCVYPNSTISNCVISNNCTNNNMRDGGGVFCDYSNEANGPISISNCLISNNTARLYGGGIYVDRATAVISNSTIVRNKATLGFGIYRSSSIIYGSCILSNSIVWGNGTDDILNNLFGDVTCFHSAIEGGYSGDSIITLSAENPPLFVNPSLTAGAEDSTANIDWHLQNGSICVNLGDNSAVTDSIDLDGTARIKRDTVDLGCYESDYYSIPIITEYDSIIYVTVTGAGTHSGNSWANATSSIDTAQTLAQTHNAVVWVAAGTYYGDTLSDNAFTMMEGVNVYGGFAGNEPADYDLSLRNFETNATILNGQNARRVLFQPSTFDTITTWDGFTLRNGQSSGYGGGAYLLGNGRLSHCIIRNNVAKSGSSVVTYGGGVYANSAIIDNCLITNNNTYCSGYRSDGGGVAAYYTTIINTTIARNYCCTRGGGICGYSVSIINCIIWGNKSRNHSALDNIDGRDIMCYYSAVEDGWFGEHNILLSDHNQQTPMFVNPSLTEGASDVTENVDWHLLEGSPCINRGHNASVTDSFDLAGTMRVKRDAVDMGCYESDYYSVPIVDNYSSVIHVTPKGSGNQTGEDWANATSSIAFASELARTYNSDVWVASGTYYGDTTITFGNAFTMLEGVNVYGGFVGDESNDYDLSLRDFEAHPTILDGQNKRRVLGTDDYLQERAIWDGFTIQNGNQWGVGGVYLDRYCTLNHCIVRNNKGWGIYVGSAMGISLNDVVVSNCKIVNNTGGGLNSVSGKTLVKNCLVTNNGTIEDANGGINGSFKVECTSVLNNIGYGISGGTGNILTNSIVWGNHISDSTLSNISGNIICSYSAIEDGYSGDSIVTLNAQNPPLFVNPSLTAGADDSTANVDWHLQQGSPCINSGDNSSVTDSVDLDGNPRVHQERVDMGCYEWQYDVIDSVVSIIVIPNDAALGTVTGSGTYTIGDTVTLHAIPNQHVRFLRWSDNDTANPRVVIAETDTTFTAIFEYYLPELHVTSISHSDFVGGEPVTISWTVQNDGTAPTPNGEVWYDRVWLSVESRVAAGDNNPILLGVFPNVSALAPGEYYTQTQSFDIPLSIAGSYYLFVITDANDATVIYWDSVVQNPYNPPPYIRAYSHHCSGAECGNYAGNRILEITEVDDYPYYHDNFFYELVNIAIPPLPDLKIPALSSNIQNFYSGSQVNLTFQVLNDGNYDTRVQQWKDVVFISYHSEFDETARVLKTISHQGLLLPDSSYQVSTTVTVPLEMHGTAYFYAYTDYYDQVYEHVGRYNNVTRSDSVNVILTPPADLIPQNITADNTVSTGASFHFSYEIHNQGAGAPNYSTWLDRCYLSTSADSLVDAIQVANDWHYSGLPVGDSYTVSHTVALPTSITEGTYYLFVQADANNSVFEFTFENNNLLRYAQPITVLQPDLQITTLNVQDTLHAGAEEAISYRIANTGNGAVINQTVKDRVYLSQSFNGSSATQIAELSHSCWLNAQDSLLKMQNVTLPSNLQEGVYYLFVRTNAANTLQEANIDNNRSPIKQVYIHYQPLPDLIITNVTMPEVIVAGDTVVLGVHLKNNGEIAANISNLTWKMVDTVGNQEVECTIRPDNAGVATLAAGDSIYLVKHAFIPPAVSGNPVSLTLVVNPNHVLTESNYSNNKYTIIHAVQPYPFDLSVNQLNAPAGVVSGEYINVTWRVKNEGSVPVSSHSGSGSGSRETVDQSVQWYDKVYLSQDSIFDNTDVEIGYYDRRTVVYAGRQYNVNKSFQIPVYADGNYYILVVSDADSATFDCQRTNNVRGKPIAVTQSALPDLQMDTLLAPNTLTTGASYQIPFTVSNEGDHITHGDRWTDALYLNDEPTTKGAELLGSRIHNGQLDVNGQYADSIAVTIPNTWIGDGYLIGYTDATDQIFEKNSDSNNLFILPVSVARPLPCDLTVLPPDFPQSANVGENVQISWELQNIGQNVAQGSIKDAVYLSMDSIWSSDDIMLGSVQYAVSLVANGQEQRSVTFPLQGVPTGDYYVVVRTNILNALNENSYTNNKAVSLMTMHVDYPSLYVDQEEQVQLNSGQSVYYKLEVGPEYEHQTLSCKLTAPTPNVSNGLYIAYSSAPSASNFDWSATVPYNQEQEILIPSLKQGTYYIMVTGQTIDNSSQNVTILASIINFEIISVNANSGVNTGSVTTQIIGAKFDTIMDFRLANSNGYLPAEKVFFHNSTETYATFNLRDQETGVYDMVAELPGGIITVKGQAFVVEHGLPAELLSNIIAPASVRNGNTFTVTIEYGNNGSTDLNISGFLLVSTNGFPIAFESDSLVNNATELTFETAEPNGNPDVIRPGYFATKTIFVKANRVGNINLKLYPIRRQY